MATNFSSNISMVTTSTASLDASLSIFREMEPPPVLAETPAEKPAEIDFEMVLTDDKKSQVSRDAMHYEHLKFECIHYKPTTIKVSLGTPGSLKSLTYMEEATGGYTLVGHENEKEKTIRSVGQGDCVVAAVEKFLKVLLKPDNSFGVLKLEVEKRRNPEQKERILSMIGDALSTIQHQIPVEKLIMQFENFRELTNLIKHLVPGHLKVMEVYRHTDRAQPIQSELDELAETEQFRKAKGLKMHRCTLSLPQEKTAHFSDLRCEEEVFKVERMDGYIDNFLRPNGWAVRSLYFESLDRSALLDYLENRAQREFGKSLDDVEQSDMSMDQAAQSITFKRGFHQCTVTYYSHKRGEFGVLYEGEKFNKIKFENRDLMLWEVEKRPEEVTEEVVKKEKKRLMDKDREEMKKLAMEDDGWILKFLEKEADEAENERSSKAQRDHQNGDRSVQGSDSHRCRVRGGDQLSYHRLGDYQLSHSSVRDDRNHCCHDRDRSEFHPFDDQCFYGRPNNNRSADYELTYQERIDRDRHCCRGERGSDKNNRYQCRGEEDSHQRDEVKLDASYQYHPRQDSHQRADDRERYGRNPIVSHGSCDRKGYPYQLTNQRGDCSGIPQYYYYQPRYGSSTRINQHKFSRADDRSSGRNLQSARGQEDRYQHGFDQISRGEDHYHQSPCYNRGKDDAYQHICNQHSRGKERSTRRVADCSSARGINNRGHEDDDFSRFNRPLNVRSLGVRCKFIDDQKTRGREDRSQHDFKACDLSGNASPRGYSHLEDDRDSMPRREERELSAPREPRLNRSNLASQESNRYYYQNPRSYQHRVQDDWSPCDQPGSSNDRQETNHAAGSRSTNKNSRRNQD